MKSRPRINPLVRNLDTAIMRDIKTTGRRFQFSLRRVLLWTAVVAVYCGLVKLAAASEAEWLEPFDNAWFAGSMSVVAIVSCVLRAAIPQLIAWHLSALAGMFILLATAFAPVTFNPIRLPEEVLVVVFFGSGMGWISFLVVECTCRFVNWGDRFIERMTMARPRD